MAKQISEDIIANCPRCKQDLTHTIMTLDGEEVEKVLCKTCKNEHVYKAPKEGKTPSKKKISTANSKKNTISPLEEWERAMEQAKDAPISVYAMDGYFREGEKVDHSKFGLGLIRKLIQPNKMEIIFEEGAKFLIRGRS